jgi:hypothetical protein
LQFKKQPKMLKPKLTALSCQAEAQRLQRQTLTSEILQQQAIEKWNGQFPTVMGGGGTLPLINIAPPSSQAATGVK